MSTVPPETTPDAAAVLRSVLGETGERAVVQRHHPLRTAVALAVALLLAAIAYFGFVVNPNIQWSVVREYLFDPYILGGVWTTLEITLISMVVSVVGAVAVALMRMSQSRVMRWTAAAYIFTFRGIPIILLLILVGNSGLFVRHITIGIPGTHWNIVDEQTSQLLTPFVASIVGLSLAGSAYMSEVVRSGFLSVGKGQRDAARALGLTRSQTTRFVVMPPALKVIVPPMGNEFIALLKATAIVSVIGGGDLLNRAQNISGMDYRTIELLFVAAWWYFVLIAALSIGQHFLERRVADR